MVYQARISLSSTGFYATPKINWDRVKGSGRPFFYFAYGAAVTEVVIDTLTGENRILRTDILHDTGASLNPALDIGQIEGAYVQGAGWLTTEELVWNGKGRADHPRALDLQDPGLFGPPARLQRGALGQAQPRGLGGPVEGGGRAAVQPWHFGALCAVGCDCGLWRRVGLCGAGCACHGRAGAGGGASGSAMFDLASLEAAVAAQGRVARVVIAAFDGSSPREVGAAMLVWADGQSGTVGGGALEWQAVRPRPCDAGHRRHTAGPRGVGAKAWANAAAGR